MDVIGDLFSPQDLDGWSILAAALALLAGWIIARFARRGVRVLGARMPTLSPVVVSVAARVAGYAVWLFAAGVALAFLGANVQPLFIGILLVGGILVLALRGLADNFGAGLVLQVRRPFVVGDEIEYEDTVGVVREVNARSVVVETYDGATVHLPNADLLGNVFANNTLLGTRRSVIGVRAADIDDPSALESTVLGALRGLPGVVAQPEPALVFTEASHDRVVAEVRLWHASTDGSRARSEAIVAISHALRAAGITATVQGTLSPPSVTPPPTV